MEHIASWIIFLISKTFLSTDGFPPEPKSCVCHGSTTIVNWWVPTKEKGKKGRTTCDTTRAPAYVTVDTGMAQSHECALRAYGLACIWRALWVGGSIRLGHICFQIVKCGISGPISLGCEATIEPCAKPKIYKKKSCTN